MTPRGSFPFLNQKNKKMGVLYSGGLDSAALVCSLLEKGFEVWPVYVRSGLRWEKKEIFWAKKFLNSISRPQLRPLGFARLILENAYDKNWSWTGKTPGARSQDLAVFLPARNLLLIIKSLLALSSKKISHLALGTLNGNPFLDAQKPYFRSLERILTSSFQTPIRIHSPFRSFSKTDIIRGSQNWPIHLSLSCINPSGYFHCGRCNKCAERKRAFKRAGITDRTTYKG